MDSDRTNPAVADDESHMNQMFIECEKVVGELGDRGCDQSRLQKALENLSELEENIEKLQLFSVNEEFHELSSGTLQFLLVPAYLAYVMENIPTPMESRPNFLRSAKRYFREFLERLLLYHVIEFKLSWLNDSNEQINEDEEKPTILSRERKRQEKIQRANAQKTWGEALAAVQHQRKTNNDDFSMRESIIIQLRIWALKALDELDMIELEMPLAERAILVHAGKETHVRPTRPTALPPFIIAKSEQQRSVFGLGYPSIPSYTVEQWCEQMQNSGKFRHVDKPTVTHIDGSEENAPQETNEDEDDSEEARQKKVQWDEYKDWHRRGYGNTDRKG